jgi:hypothetical protein
MKKLIPIVFIIISCNYQPTSNSTSATTVDSNNKIATDTLKSNLNAAKKNAEKEKQINELKKKFKIKKDEFQSTTFYLHKSWGNGWPDRTTIYSYFNSNGNLFLVTNFYGGDWIFHSSATVIIGSDKYETSDVPSYSDWNKHQNSSGEVWENVSHFSEEDKDIVKAISENQDKVIKVRLHGREFSKDFILSSKDKAAIKDVYTLFTLL